MADIPLSVNPKGRAVVIVLGVFLALDYVFVFIRYYARHFTKRRLEFNDWALFAALIFVSALYFIEIAAVRNGGVGLHVMEIATQWGGMPTIFTAGKLVLTADILWNMATLTIKMSILHLYISVFGLVSKPFRQAVWIVMGICVLSTVVFIIQILVLCRPLAYFWDKSIAGTCGSLNLTYLIPGIIITVEDLVVFTLPMPMLWKLKMERKKKLGTMFVFGIGFGICMMSGVRLKYVVELKTEDFTESIWEFAILGTLEPMFGIISACLPVIPAVVSHYSSGRMMAWSTKGGSGHGTGKSGLASKGLSSTSGHSAHADFQRLSDHEYPLIEQVKPASHAQSEVVGDDWQTHNTGAPGGNIMVTKQFTVDSREGSGRGKKEDV